MCIRPVLPCLLIAAALLRAQTSIPSEVKLTAATFGGQKVFHVGERITIELTYATVPQALGKYIFSTASYDRSGRLGVESFEVTPKTGWDDPLEAYFRSYQMYMGGGLSSMRSLNGTSQRVTRNLNEWVRFDTPGSYRVIVRSGRVQQPGIRDPSRPSIEVQSNELKLTIVPATPEWQQATLSQAVQTLNNLPPAEPHPELVADQRDRAVATLRYLGTAAAAKEMALRIDDPVYGFEYLLGLASTPSRAAALKCLEDLLNDSSTPVSNSLIEAIALVKLPPEIEASRPRQRELFRREAMEQLAQVVSRKRGKARAISIFTIIDGIGVRSGELPPNEKRELSEGVVAGFDDLTLRQQNMLLEYRWNLLDPGVMLPVLEKVARRESPDHTDANEGSGTALRRWWQLDPAGARPVILHEIARAQPRFGLDVLGVLPDKTLPEVDGPLWENLKADTSGKDKIAALIARYATNDLESEVVDYLEPRIGEFACAEQSPLLAYLLRVDPGSGEEFLKKAVAARGIGFSACNHSLLMDVARTYNAPSLQDVAIHNLQDDDPQVATDAAQYLGEHGDASAAAPLWECLEAWSAKWKGRQHKLLSGDGPNDEGVWQSALGDSLLLSLATGRGGLIEDAGFDRLASLSVTVNQQQRVEQWRKQWDERPRSVRMAVSPASIPLFYIAQYEELPFDEAAAKLSQFPAGTVFRWAAEPANPDEAAVYAQMRERVASRGIVLQ